MTSRLVLGVRSILVGRKLRLASVIECNYHREVDVDIRAPVEHRGGSVDGWPGSGVANPSYHATNKIKTHKRGELQDRTVVNVLKIWSWLQGGIKCYGSVVKYILGCMPVMFAHSPLPAIHEIEK